MPRPSSTALPRPATGALLTPGFIDLHGHGGGGFSYGDGSDAIRGARALHRAHGTTRAVISLVTASLETLEQQVAEIADLVTTDADILGSHLEGPFLDPGHKGAHDPSLLREPEAADVERLLAAGRGTIRQVTLAPELPGGFDAIRAVVGGGRRGSGRAHGGRCRTDTGGVRCRRDDPDPRLQRDAAAAPPAPRARRSRRRR